MPDYVAEPSGDLGEALAKVREEFVSGLRDRVKAMQLALDVLESAYDQDALEVLFHKAHSLKGTAPGFDGEAMVKPASALADTARRWLDIGEVEPAELAEATRELGRLRISVDQYIENESR